MTTHEREQYTIFDIRKFNIVYGAIDIPSNTLLYRAYNPSYPTISNRPTFYTFDKNLANGYVQPGYKMNAFKTTKPLRFYDLRYIRTILSDLFPQKKLLARDNNLINYCKTLALAYGVCSLSRQIELYKERYPNNDIDRLNSIEDFFKLVNENIYKNELMNGINPIEARGVRIAETTNDTVAVAVLKEIFQNKIDGYIASEMKSPYHIEKTGNMHPPEIVIFDPKTNGITLEENEPTSEQINVLNINEILSTISQIQQFNFPGYDHPTIQMRQLGGKNKDFIKKYIPVPIAVNEIFSKGGKSVDLLEKKIKKTVYKMTSIHSSPRKELPHPTCKINPWITSSISLEGEY